MPESTTSPSFWFLGFWVSGCLGVWGSGFLGFWVSGFLGFWFSEFLGFWGSGVPGVSGFLGFWACTIRRRMESRRVSMECQIQSSSATRDGAHEPSHPPCHQRGDWRTQSVGLLSRQGCIQRVQVWLSGRGAPLGHRAKGSVTFW